MDTLSVPILNIESITREYKYVFIRRSTTHFPNIGLKLKIIVDQIKDVQVIVSGSSVLDIHTNHKNRLREGI